MVIMQESQNKKNFLQKFMLVIELEKFLQQNTLKRLFCESVLFTNKNKKKLNKMFLKLRNI